MRNADKLITDCQVFRELLEGYIATFEKQIGGKIDHVTIHDGKLEKFDVKFDRFIVVAGAETFKF